MQSEFKRNLAIEEAAVRELGWRPEKVKAESIKRLSEYVQAHRQQQRLKTDTVLPSQASQPLAPSLSSVSHRLPPSLSSSSFFGSSRHQTQTRLVDDNPDSSSATTVDAVFTVPVPAPAPIADAPKSTFPTNTTSNPNLPARQLDPDLRTPTLTADRQHKQTGSEATANQQEQYQSSTYVPTTTTTTMNDWVRTVLDTVNEIEKEFGDCSASLCQYIAQVRAIHSPSQSDTLSTYFSSGEQSRINLSLRSNAKEAYWNLYRMLLHVYQYRIDYVQKLSELLSMESQEFFQERHKLLLSLVTRFKQVTNI